MLRPIRIDFTSIWKKRHHTETHVGRTHSIDSGWYCHSWFLKPAIGQLSRHTTFICKHIKKKSANKGRFKKKKRSSGAVADSDTLSAYSEELQWEYTHWIIHYGKALIYCGNNIHLIKRFCFAAVGRLHIVYCYKLMAVQRRLWAHPNNRSVMAVLYIMAFSAAS